ncbi:MAG: hypothetical protein ABH863_04875 [Candidatus Micrarchaeota archaeon]
MNDEFASKYPFSERAREFLSRENIAAVSDVELELAKERVMRSLQGLPARAEKNARGNIVSYVLSRILLGAAGNPAATARFAGFEARQAVELLKSDDDGNLEIISREFFHSAEFSTEGASVGALDYLKFGGDLANEAVSNGKLRFSRSGFIQILRKAIEIKIADISILQKSLPPNIRKYSQELSEEMGKLQLAPKGIGDFRGKYLSLPAIMKIMEGLGEGKRYYGSMTLAIACLKDGLPREQAEGVMITYARNCARSTHGFTEREALASLEWVLRHPTINFSMKTLREQGILDERTLADTEIAMRKLRKK